MDNTDNKLVVKIKSPNIPYLKNTKVDVLFGIYQIVNILNTLDELFSTVCILFCENTAVKSPKRMDLIISLLSVEFFNNKLTSFCQVLCDKYLLRVVFQIFFLTCRWHFLFSNRLTTRFCVFLLISFLIFLLVVLL